MYWHGNNSKCHVRYMKIGYIIYILKMSIIHDLSWFILSIITLTTGIGGAKWGEGGDPSTSLFELSPYLFMKGLPLKK